MLRTHSRGLTCPAPCSTWRIWPDPCCRSPTSFPGTPGRDG